MSERPPDGRTPPPEEPDVDPGPPIAALEELAQPPSEGFLARVRARIERRSLTNQLVAMSWHVPRIIVIEFLNMVFQVFGPQKDGKGDPQ